MCFVYFRLFDVCIFLLTFYKLVNFSQLPLSLLLTQKLLDAYEEQNVDAYTDSVSKHFDHL